MLGADLVVHAARRIEAGGCRAPPPTSTPTLWLKVDSFSLLQALATWRSGWSTSTRQAGVAAPAGPQGPRAHLDLLWIGQAMSTETADGLGDRADARRRRDQPLTVRDVVERTTAPFWFERERVRHESFFRFLLPLAAPAGEQWSTRRDRQADSRPRSTTSTCSRQRPSRVALDRAAARPSSPTPCSTPRPPG